MKDTYPPSALKRELMTRMPNAIKREVRAAEEARAAIKRRDEATNRTRERADRLAKYLPVIIRPASEGEMLEIKRWRLESQGTTGDPSGESRQAGTFEVHGIDYEYRDEVTTYHLKGPEASSQYEGGETYHTTWEAVTANREELLNFVIEQASKPD